MAVQVSHGRVPFNRRAARGDFLKVQYRLPDVLPSKLDRFSTTIEAIKVSKDLSGSRWALFGETISVNDLYYFASVNELG